MSIYHTGLRISLWGISSGSWELGTDLMAWRNAAVEGMKAQGARGMAGILTGRCPAWYPWYRGMAGSRG